MANVPAHLVDVNVVLALLDEDHVHHKRAVAWFNTPGLQWAMCPFSEAGVLRFFLRPKLGDMAMKEVTAMLDTLKEQPGYTYRPISADWQTLTKPFAKRLHGHNQITDAYLLGLAIREGLILTTFAKGLLHLAGEHNGHIHLLRTL